MFYCCRLFPLLLKLESAYEQKCSETPLKWEFLAPMEIHLCKIWSNVDLEKCEK